jgi:hypothetical protein
VVRHEFLARHVGCAGLLGQTNGQTVERIVEFLVTDDLLV